MKQPNYLFSILSTAIILFFIGGATLFGIYGQMWIREYKEQVQVMIEFRENTSQTTIDSMRLALKTQPYVREHSIRFIPKDEAAKIMREDLGEDFLTTDIGNPLLDMLIFKTNANYVSADKLDKLKADIERDIHIQEVNYDEPVVGAMHRNFDGMGWWILLLAAPLLWINAYLIYNKTRFVSAVTTETTIPPFRRSLINGLWSGLLAIIGLGAIGYWLQGVLPELSDYTDDNILFIWVFVGVLSIAMLLYLGATWIVPRKTIS
jgi:cell division transport system permease protein